MNSSYKPNNSSLDEISILKANRTTDSYDSPISPNPITTDEERQNSVPTGTASTGKALFMLLKAFVGTGVIFLPGSFVSGGLVFSIILLIFIAAICLVAFQILIIAQQKTGGSYGDVAEVLYGPWLRYIVFFFLCLSQMGFVASYLIFISQNLGFVANSLSHCTSTVDSKYYIWVAIAFIVPITWVRKMERLSWAAIIADVFILFGLICVIYFCADQIARNGSGPNILTINSKDFGLMIGTAVFSFEGIGMVVPIIESMREPKKFSMVLNIGIAIVTCVFVLIGTLGYVAYGEHTQANVTSNLPAGPLSITVQFLYACAIVLTSPFMLYPAINIIEYCVFGDGHSRSKSLKLKWEKNFVRSLVAIVCAAVSFGVGSEGLNKFVSLVGSLACMPLCFIIPGMFHYKVTDDYRKKIGDVILAVWGFGILIYTLYVNINSWIYPVYNIRSSGSSNNSVNSNEVNI
ncbi:transmembrane amino acid transporter protein-domain-containing protein [Phycomyces blakesleeanus]